MPTVTQSIGSAGGRTYSTLQAWENALPANLVTDGNSYVGECYNDSEFTAALTIAGSTTDATHTITLTCASGQSFKDNASAASNALYYNQANGVGIKVAATFSAITVNNDDVTLRGLQIKGISGVYARPTLDISNLTRPAVVDQCIIECDIAANGVTARNATLKNTLIVAAGGGNGIVFSFGGSADSLTIVVPSNLAAAGTGVSGGTHGAATASNCAVFNFTTNFSSTGSGITFDHCGTNGTAPAGTANVGSLTYANQFQSSVNDFRLKSGSGLIDVGATTLTVDIIGQTRPSGAADDIGAWEFVAGGATFQPAWAANSTVTISSGARAA